MEILNVKVEKETKEKIETLVRARGYKNKSEALRKIIEDHFKEHPELFADDEMKEITRQVDDMSDIEFERIAAQIFRGPKSAAELVGEGRER